MLHCTWLYLHWLTISIKKRVVCGGIYIEKLEMCPKYMDPTSSCLDENWPTSNLATFTKIFMSNFKKTLS